MSSRITGKGVKVGQVRLTRLPESLEESQKKNVGRNLLKTVGGGRLSKEDAQRYISSRMRGRGTSRTGSRGGEAGLMKRQRSKGAMTWSGVG